MDWISFVVASILLTLSPGPDILYVMVESISRGAKVGISIALGLCSGLIVHTTAAAFGISIIIRQNDWLFLTLKIIGAIYLLYLAYLTIRVEWRKAPGKLVDGDLKKSNWAYFKRGFTMNVVNPKVTLFFLAFLPQFIPQGTSTPFFDTYFLGLLFMIQAIAIFSAVAFLSGKFNAVIQNKKVYRATLIFKIIVLTFIAVQILTL
jgi:threonine/homoserine/homoserine lactone efflux protein